MEHFRFGVRAEKRVEQLLRSFSWRAFRTERSRGPFDIIASTGTCTMVIQVKAVRVRTLVIADAGHALRTLRARVSSEGEHRLDHEARELRASALMGLVNGSRVWLYDFSAGCYRLNFEGRLPELRAA